MMFGGRKNNLGLPGFNLVEIGIVIVIIVMLALFTFSFWKTFLEKNKLNSAAVEMVSTLRDAQQRTVTEQVVYLVHFYSASGVYDLIRINPSDGSRQVIKSVTLQGGISMSSVSFSTNEVQFNAGGGVSAPGTVILTNGTLNVTIDVKASGFTSFRF